MVFCRRDGTSDVYIPSGETHVQPSKPTARSPGWEAAQEGELRKPGTNEVTQDLSALGNVPPRAAPSPHGTSLHP